MKQNKWFDSKAELQVGDLVYFKKEESELSSRWTVGKITEVIHSKDGQVRRATVQYQNANEKEFRLTDRASRISHQKLWIPFPTYFPAQTVISQPFKNYESNISQPISIFNLWFPNPSRISHWKLWIQHFHVQSSISQLIKAMNLTFPHHFQVLWVKSQLTFILKLIIKIQESVAHKKYHIREKSAWNLD